MQAVLLAGLLGAVALVIAGVVPGSGARLSHAATGWIAVEVILELVAIAAYALLFYGCFSYGAYRIGVLRSAQIGIGELGAFVVSPTGAAGPALRIWALLRSGMPFAILTRRSVIHAICFNVPYVSVAILLALGVATGIGAGHAALLLSLVPFALVVGSVVLAAAATLIARRVPGEPGSRWRRIGYDIVRAVPDGLRELPTRARRPWLLPASIGYWVGDCGVLVAAVHAVHGSAPIAVIALAYMLGQLGNALPLPGGVGAVEPAMLGVLTASGVNPAVGAAAVVLYRFVSLGMQAAAGAIAVATLVPALRRAPIESRPSTQGMSGAGSPAASRSVSA